jgi:hypothetical protein
LPLYLLRCPPRLTMRAPLRPCVGPLPRPSTTTRDDADRRRQRKEKRGPWYGSPPASSLATATAPCNRRQRRSHRDSRMLQDYVSDVSEVCLKCFVWMLQK